MAPHGDDHPGSTPAPTSPGVEVERLFSGALLDPEVIKFVILWKVLVIRALSLAHTLRIVCLT